MKKLVRSKKFFLTTLGVVMVCAGAAIALHKGDEKPVPEPIVKINDFTVALTKEAMANVGMQKAKVVEVPDKLSIMGKVSPTEDRTVSVPTRVDGRIDAVFVASGETVKKGQILLEIFSADFIEAREEYLQSLRLGQDKGSGISSDFVDMAKLSRKKLLTMGMSAGDIEKLASGDKEMKLIIRAPRDGILISKEAVIGKQISAGDSLFTIADVSKVWFNGDLYQEDLPKVHAGQQIDIETVTGEKPVGTISFISPVVDPETRTIKVRALMDNPNKTLKADMYIQGNLILQQRQKLIIPTRALTRSGNMYTVFKHVGEDRFERVVVKTGYEQGDNTVIEAGLWDGDDIVCDGGALLLNAALEAEDIPKITATNSYNQTDDKDNKDGKDEKHEDKKTEK